MGEIPNYENFKLSESDDKEECNEEKILKMNKNIKQMKIIFQNFFSKENEKSENLKDLNRNSSLNSFYVIILLLILKKKNNIFI